MGLFSGPKMGSNLYTHEPKIDLDREIVMRVSENPRIRMMYISVGDTWGPGLV